MNVLLIAALALLSAYLLTRLLLRAAVVFIGKGEAP